ncbi:hypothetical protein [Polystyrenella longa]|uniref:hypothetical protein n=1 Tax=Polystyrenella longa TaxID=2528007 RepID=UPI0011A8E2B8|nr:hypothetical protein [Polystyrenella longa]
MNLKSKLEHFIEDRGNPSDPTNRPPVFALYYDAVLKIVACYDLSIRRELVGIKPIGPITQYHWAINPGIGNGTDVNDGIYNKFKETARSFLANLPQGEELHLRGNADYTLNLQNKSDQLLNLLLNDQSVTLGPETRIPVADYPYYQDVPGITTIGSRRIMSI